MDFGHHDPACRRGRQLPQVADFEKQQVLSIATAVGIRLLDTRAKAVNCSARDRSPRLCRANAEFQLQDSLAFTRAADS